METDGVTVQGFCCFWCNGYLRRRRKGTKQKEMEAILEEPEEQKKWDDGLQKELVKFVADETLLLQDTQPGKSQQPQQQVRQDQSVAEIFDLPGSLIYPPHVFLEEHGEEGWQQGFELKDWPTPVGTIRGYRIKDHNRRPLHPEVIPVRRQVKMQASLNSVIDDGSDMLDRDQMADAFKFQASQCVFSEKDRASKLLPLPQATPIAAGRKNGAEEGDDNEDKDEAGDNVIDDNDNDDNDVVVGCATFCTGSSVAKSVAVVGKQNPPHPSGILEVGKDNKPGTLGTVRRGTASSQTAERQVGAPTGSGKSAAATGGTKRTAASMVTTLAGLVSTNGGGAIAAEPASPPVKAAKPRKQEATPTPPSTGKRGAADACPGTGTGSAGAANKRNKVDNIIAECRQARALQRLGGARGWLA